MATSRCMPTLITAVMNSTSSMAEKRTKPLRRPTIRIRDFLTFTQRRCNDNDHHQRIRYDHGSSAGPKTAVLGMDLLTPRGTTYLATAPGELVLARAYVSGDIEARGVPPGDPYELLKLLADKVEFGRPSARLLASIIRSVGIEHLVPAPPPPQEALPRWRRIAGGMRHTQTLG